MKKANLENTVADAVKSIPNRYKPWHTVLLALVTILSIVFAWGQTNGSINQRLKEHDQRISRIDSTLKSLPLSIEQWENLNQKLIEVNKNLEDFNSKLREHDNEFKDIWKNYARRNFTN